MPPAIRIHHPGGPEVLRWESVPAAAPGPKDALVRQTACGLNYIDTYHRSGLYPLPLPSGLGMEAAGVVEAVGADVTDLKPGDRVAYAGGGPGAYAEKRVMPAFRLVKLPAHVDDKTGAAMMLKGMTAVYLLYRTFKVQKGQTVLFHAAAGGVGLIACQLLKQIGATVIGTVGSDAKAELAKAHGCDHAVVYTRENFKDRVKEITGGKGVPVVYDSVGADTFMDSLDCLSPQGFFVSFGNASGPVKPFETGILAAKGSLYFTRPTMATHTGTKEDIAELTGVLFDAMAKGLKIEVNQTYALKDAAQAHRDLEGRKTTGSTVLLT
ncbi:MAG: quinone oxidoreductase [Alphaproteobacteria bacterium]